MTLSSPDARLLSGRGIDAVRSVDDRGLGTLERLTDEVFSAINQSNIPLWQAIQRQGFQPRSLLEPTLHLDRIAGILELHIEQERSLDEWNEHLGVVMRIRAQV